MKRLKELVSIKGKGKKELAQNLNISIALVYKWLNDETKPSLKNLIEIADYYNVTIDYLIGRTDEDTIVHTKSTVPFDTNIKNILNNKHITKYRLFKDCGFSDGHEYSWFNLKNAPRYDNLLKMADYLNISMDELIGRVI